MAPRVYRTAEEAAADFGAVIAELREGHRVRVGELEITAASPDQPPAGRNADEIVSRAKEFEARLGYAPRMDESFAADLREIATKRERLSARAWE